MVLLRKPKGDSPIFALRRENRDSPRDRLEARTGPWPPARPYRSNERGLRRHHYITFSTFPPWIDRSSACTILMVTSVDSIKFSAGFSPFVMQSIR